MKKLLSLVFFSLVLVGFVNANTVSYGTIGTTATATQVGSAIELHTDQGLIGSGYVRLNIPGGIALNAITSLSYTAKVTSVGAGGYAPEVVLNIDADNDGAEGTGIDWMLSSYDPGELNGDNFLSGDNWPASVGSIDSTFVNRDALSGYNYWAADDARTGFGVLWTPFSTIVPGMLSVHGIDSTDMVYSIDFVVGTSPNFDGMTALFLSVELNGIVYPLIPPTEVWVDDDYDGSLCTSDGHIWQYDCFNSIQDGIDSVEGSIVNVAAGTYNEDIIIDKSLTLYGAQSGVDARGRVASESEVVGVVEVTSDATNIIIDGFKFTSPTRAFTPRGFNLHVESESSTIENNIFVAEENAGHTYSGYLDFNGITSTTVEQNTFSGHLDSIQEPNVILLGITGAGTVTVSNNEMHDVGGGGGIGIMSTNEDAIINIENNEIDNTGDCIWVWAPPSTEFDTLTINSNNLHDCAKKGVKVVGTVVGDIFVNYNSIYDNTEEGVYNGVVGLTVDATYNWWGDCNGPYHPTTNPLANGDEVSDNVDYDPWLGICIENKIDVQCNYSSDDIELSADVTGLDIDSVWFEVEVNGVRTNRTDVTNVGDRYFYVLDSSELTGEEWIGWTVWANDTHGNEFNNSWKTFYVIKRTELSVNPTDPGGSDPWYITEPEFSLTKDINEAGTTYYRWDSTPDILYIAPFGLEDVPNNDPPEAAGTLELNYWTNFNSCGNEPEQSKMFYIDLTDTNITDLNPGDGSTVYNNLRPEISAYLDEVYGSNSGVNPITVIMKVDGIPVTPDINPADAIDYTLSYTPVSDLSLGSHTVYVYVEDNAGRVSELTWEFDIQTTTAFSMAVESPENKVYGNRRIPVIVSLDSDVELLGYQDNGGRWRRLCRNCDGYDRTKSFREGEHELVIRATDEFGWTKEETINFEVDSRKPRISRIEPKRKSTTNGENFKVKYTENNLNNVEVSINDGVDTATYGLIGCEAGRNKECSTILDLSNYDGQWISYWFNVSDSVNTVSSRVYTVKVDTTDPILIVNEPDQGVTYGRRVPFNLDVTNEKVRIIEYQDNLGRWRRLCSRCDEYDRTKSFRRGSHVVNIRAVDYAGNIDQETINFNVDY